jgi:hypothetical protein
MWSRRARGSPATRRATPEWHEGPPAATRHKHLGLGDIGP